MTSSPPERLAPRHVGKYRLLHALGSGGTGVVFAAVHEGIGVRAAIKLLHPELARDPLAVRRFFDEARASGQVRHPGIVQIFDLGQLPDGSPYILMELLEGESLRRRLLCAGASLAEVDALRLARQAACALRAVHQQAIVHRDLKPENLFIVRDSESPSGERVKILDFGLAKILSPSAEVPPHPAAAMRTRSGAVLGTPVYMAPEQCRGGRQVDERADVYALGVILYEMLAGQPPFSGAGTGEVLAMHIYEAPAPLRARVPGLSSGVMDLVHAMLAKMPADRPDMGQVAAMLERLTATRTGPSRDAPDPRAADDRPERPGALISTLGDGPAAPRRTAWRLPGVVLGLIALALAGFAVRTVGRSHQRAAADAASPIARRSDVPPPPVRGHAAAPAERAQAPARQQPVTAPASPRPALRRAPGRQHPRQDPPAPVMPAPVQDHEIEIFE